MDYNARFFSPALGRFISADTIVPGAGNPVAFNRYAYALNSPLMRIDPSGHDSFIPLDVFRARLYAMQHEFHTNPIYGTLGVKGDTGKLYRDYGSAVGAMALREFDNDEDYYKAASSEKVLNATMFPGCDYCLPESELAGFAGLLAEADGNNLASYHPAGLMMLSGSLRAGDPGECSFSADTLVSTDAGYVPIAGVITGTRVLAWDETGNTTGYYPVTNVWAHWDPVLVVLIIDGETITTTPEHPFYTLMRGWLPAGELWVGTGLQRADGGAGIVESTTRVTCTELMWNLTVEQAHTYFVSPQAWLVHNQCPIGSYPEGSFSLTKEARETIPQGARPPQNTVYRLLPDSEYQSARQLANGANRAFRVENGLLGNSNGQVHEIVPVKFGGDPVAHFNKVVLEQSFHRLVTTSWRALQTAIGR
jgi:hypothetical protein